jgi:hypothetical protein
MHDEEQRIDTGDLPLASIDLLPHGGWVAIARGNGRQYLSFNGDRFDLPESCRFPVVRAIDDERAILVDTLARPPCQNAWIMTAAGNLLAQFRVGDAITEVVPFETHLIVAYFDEAFGNREELDGVVVFDYVGNVLAHQSFMQCYCAVPLPRNRLLYLEYPDFPIVRFDLASHTEERWAAPPRLYGSNAVTYAGDVAFFHSPYDDERGIYRWSLGATDATRIGEYTGPLRGLSRGRFLAEGGAGYTIVSVVDEIVDER